MWCGICYICAPVPEFYIEGEDRENAEDDEHDRILSGWSTPKSEAERFRKGRNGDDLTTLFECDYCIFRKLYGRNSDESSQFTQYAMACIRRINLDACLSRATSTVSGNASQV